MSLLSHTAAGLRSFVLVVAGAATACAPRAAQVDASDHLGLRDGLETAPAIELFAVQELLPAAKLAASRIEDRRGVEATAKALGAGGDPTAVRVLLGGVGESQISELLRVVGFDVSDGGFEILGRRFDGPTDGVVLTLPDPDRPGLPLRVYAGVRPESLVGVGDLIELDWKPSFELWREGTPEARGRFEGHWPPRAVLDDDRGGLWEAYRIERRPSALGALQLRAIPSKTTNERGALYLQRAALAKQRALEWSGIDPRTVGATIHLHESTQAFVARFGRPELAIRSPFGSGIHVLTTEDDLDDRGRAVAELVALRTLGPPAEPWLLDALGIWACNHWWDRPLGQWVARLQGAALAASVDELIGDAENPLGTVHRDAPQLGFLFGWLLETRGPDYVRALWAGRERLESDEELEVAFHEALEANRQAYAERLGRNRQAFQRTARSVPFLRGAFLVPPSTGDGLLGPTGASALVDLRALGMNTVALELRAHETTEGITGSLSDEELLLFSARAAAVKLTTILVPNLLESASGELSARSKYVSTEQLEGLFQRYERFAVHYALVAELARIPVMAIGSELGAMVDTRPVRPEDLHRLDEAGERERESLDPTVRARAAREAEQIALENAARGVRAAGWDTVIARVRPAYDGQLTYVAGSPSQRNKFNRWSALDLMATEHFMPLQGVRDEQEGAYEDTVDSAEKLVDKLTYQLERFAEDARKAEMPGILLGIGFPASVDSWSDPRRRIGAADPDAAGLHGSVLADALTDVLGRFDSLAGVVHWCWYADPADRLARPGGFDLRNGRDEALIRRMLGIR